LEFEKPLMDGVSGIFAVISLAVQVLDTVQKTSGFVKDIRIAPGELLELSESLIQLELVLYEVNLLLHQRYMVLRLPGSPILLLRALEECERRMKPLQAIIEDAKNTKEHKSCAQRTWASFKLVAKKERLRELRMYLRDASFDLSTAISVNSSKLQSVLKLFHRHYLLLARTYQLQISIETSRIVTENLNRQAGDEMTTAPASHNDPQVSQSRPERTEQSKYSIVQKMAIARYQGVLGAARIDMEMKCSANVPCSQVASRTVLFETSFIMVTPKILRRRFEMILGFQSGHISRRLNTYPIMSWRSSYFTMCRRGDIVGVKAALSVGGLTPFVLDEHGFTSLHVCPRTRWYKSIMRLTLCSGRHNQPHPSFVPGYLIRVWIRIVGQTTVGK
jgi:hypothetical protein